MNILGIESLGSPIFHRVNQGLVKILLLFSESKLDLGATQDTGVGSVGVWFQLEEIAKESDGRWNTKEGFTKMNEDREMKDWIRVQMVQLYVIIMQKTIEERTSRQTKSMLNQRDEQNNLTGSGARGPDVRLAHPIRQVSAREASAAHGASSGVSASWLVLARSSLLLPSQQVLGFPP
jgi:hypothetical protein